MISRRLLVGLGAAFLLGIALLGWMFALARSMPVVRTTVVALPFPPGAPRKPLRIAWMTDTHLSGPDNSPERMARVVDLVNAQHPDLILLGGDYVGQNKLFEYVYPDADAIAPFLRLRAPLGVVAVLGNHDMSWATRDTSNAIRRGFADAGIPLLINQAVRRGPLVIGGIPDLYKGRSDVPATLDGMGRLGGAPILLSHTPDIMAHIAPDHLRQQKRPPWRGLVLAGHTHCGQIALPYFGAVYVPTYTKPRYTCARYEAHGQKLVISAGVGTSGLPLRLFAPPDIWIVTVRPR